MEKEKLILTAIVATVIGTGFYFKDNVSSYFEQQVQNYHKKQERRIPFSDSFFRLGSDGKSNFYLYNLNNNDIAIEVSSKDTLTTEVDSLVIEPENAIFPYKGKNLPVYKIKKIY